MKNINLSIKRAMNYLNNEEEDGGFWLPNIQRPFVWSEDQIAKLFDSIMREYPISTLLIWKTKSAIKSRKFIDNWNDETRLSNYFVPENNKKKCLVLDGQQRLQSLFIGLKGSFNQRELFFDVLSGDLREADGVKYAFRFGDQELLEFPFVKMKDIVFSTHNQREIIDSITALPEVNLSISQMDRLRDNIELIIKTFKVEDRVAYQELNSIDEPQLYKEDDVVEIFIRANSGGTKLGKSDLLYSLLAASWEQANNEIEDVLGEINRFGFEFDRDFILKTCLVLIGSGAAYEVEKFRRPGVRGEIETKWPEIEKAIFDVVDFVRGKTFIQCDKAIPSYLALIPLIYFRYKYASKWLQVTDAAEYLVRSLLVGAFGGQPDSLIDAICREIDKSQDFDASEIFNLMQSANRNTRVTEDRLWQMGYGSANIHLLFNIWYGGSNYVPSYVNNLPEIDHIFPQSALKRIRVISPESGRPVMKYKDAVRNQLLNCMLLTKVENGAGGKRDILPDVWFAKHDNEYRKKHLIPDNPELWKIENFEAFMEARKSLILQRFNAYITR